MGQGEKTEFSATFLTSRVEYRAGITVADPEGPNGMDANAVFIPVIALHYDADFRTKREGEEAIDYRLSSNAYNGQLLLSVLYAPPAAGCDDEPSLVDGVLNPAVDTRCQAIIRVWAWGAAGIPPVSNLESMAGFWCLYHEQSVLCDTLIVLRDIPATAYKVTVDFISGGSVSIFAQHTA